LGFILFLFGCSVQKDIQADQNKIDIFQIQVEPQAVFNEVLLNENKNNRTSSE